MKIKFTKFKGLLLYILQYIKIEEDILEKFLKKNFFLKKIFYLLVFHHRKKNVLRGLHFQKKFSQGKHLTVLKGEIFDVALDLRKKIKNFW